MRTNLLGFGLLAILSLSSTSLALEVEEPKAKEAPTILVANRYLGFRAATDVTPESDYTFTLQADGKWHYRGLVGGYEKRGDLGKDLAAWKKKLAETGLADLKEPMAPPFAIADAPQMTLDVTEGGKTRKLKISPRDKVALAIDKQIQDLQKSAEKKKD